MLKKILLFYSTTFFASSRNENIQIHPGHNQNNNISQYENYQYPKVIYLENQQHFYISYHLKTLFMSYSDHLTIYLPRISPRTNASGKLPRIVGINRPIGALIPYISDQITQNLEYYPVFLETNILRHLSRDSTESNCILYVNDTNAAQENSSSAISEHINPPIQSNQVTQSSIYSYNENLPSNRVLIIDLPLLIDPTAIYTCEFSRIPIIPSALLMMLPLRARQGTLYEASFLQRSGQEEITSSNNIVSTAQTNNPSLVTSLVENPWQDSTVSTTSVHEHERNE
ncbi:hypothetical protein EDEG_02803 [Edhazardia aedis USNM 41457]|uniref:Uncharacterized protein n=1 Tax=Edhazardia aedis (strain USNM 41457) TaxID=1003232 RepID=J9DN54_EDHAE|nr:hypothetical protein EDEG_02803 [Edhazardia aedis USNM 41457]|eukprot:EJW02807.1 hypothetical protein EDEG_02803 [Edhazardia aedis USNM 41457]